MPVCLVKNLNTYEEACKEAQKHTDDALPHNFVRIMACVGHCHETPEGPSIASQDVDGLEAQINEYEEKNL